MCEFVVGDTFLDTFKTVNRIVFDYPDYVIDSRIGKTKEIVNLSYEVYDPTTYILNDPNINRISYDYAETFYDFMMSGGTNAAEAFKDYPQAIPFTSAPKSDSLPANFNTLYGPRIAKQLPAIVKELKEFPTSRRACIMILNENDHALLHVNETIEYPCTLNMTYYIRDGKVHGHVNMRSQNVATVLQMDIYIQARLLIHIADLLGLPVGTFSSNLISAHIYERDFEYVKRFLDV